MRMEIAIQILDVDGNFKLQEVEDMSAQGGDFATCLRIFAILQRNLGDH